MAEKSSYQVQNDARNLKKIKALMEDLPPFAAEYIHSRMLTSSTRTILQYCYSLRRFFIWVCSSIKRFNGIVPQEFTLDNMSKITARNLEAFMLYLQTDVAGTNSRASVAQKLAAISSLFSYLYRHDDIPANPCAKVERPKIPSDKRIIYLTDEESINLLNVIEFGHPNIPEHQMAYLEKTRCRDLAIATLMLDTGIRLSECIGMNIEDVDLSRKRIQVYRKGGKYQYLPINDEVTEILSVYITQRKNMVAQDKESDKALFLSMQNRRVSANTISNMLKKYADFADITKEITPHKLRKTYGTALYRKTRDIYLTANALGHENVGTTSKHYVDDNAESLREIANQIRVRPENATV